MPQPASAIAEAGRLLRPRGIFGFTTWCLSSPWRERAVVPDYRPLLEAQGFEVLSYEESVGWKERQLRVYEQVCERRSELEDDLGANVSGILVSEAEAASEALARSRRVVVVARRSSSTA